MISERAEMFLRRFLNKKELTGSPNGPKLSSRGGRTNGRGRAPSYCRKKRENSKLFPRIGGKIRKNPSRSWNSPNHAKGAGTIADPTLGKILTASLMP